MSRKSTKTTRLDRVRWFIAGVLEHRFANPASGAHDYRLMDAYWAGHRAGFRLPWAVRRLFRTEPSA